MTEPVPAAPCVAATDPSGCAFKCKCSSPDCDCDSDTCCKRHADAIIAHRADPDHDLHELALTAHHPND